MNTKGKNRNVQRTQALLKDGLTELMQTKPVQNITVRELTDYVNLNRGTFYLHYRDIQDLLEHLENDILDEFIDRGCPGYPHPQQPPRGARSFFVPDHNHGRSDRAPHRPVNVPEQSPGSHQ